MSCARSLRHADGHDACASVSYSQPSSFMVLGEMGGAHGGEFWAQPNARIGGKMVYWNIVDITRPRCFPHCEPGADHSLARLPGCEPVRGRVGMKLGIGGAESGLSFLNPRRQ